MGCPMNPSSATSATSVARSTLGQHTSETMAPAGKYTCDIATSDACQLSEQALRAAGRSGPAEQHTQRPFIHLGPAFRDGREASALGAALEGEPAVRHDWIGNSYPAFPARTAFGRRNQMRIGRDTTLEALRVHVPDVPNFPSFVGEFARRHRL